MHCMILKLLLHVLFTVILFALQPHIYTKLQIAPEFFEIILNLQACALFFEEFFCLREIVSACEILIILYITQYIETHNQICEKKMSKYFRKIFSRIRL